MSVLTASQLGKLYGPDEIFSGISLEIPHRARIALVGPNGAGKTTLLNILIGEDLPNAGTVSRMKGLRIGFLPQRPEIHGDHTIFEEMLNAFAELRALESQLALIAEQLTITTGEAHDAKLVEYGELQTRFEEGGGYTYEQRMRTVLHGLGFTPQDYHRQLTTLSGGQKTRVLLARLLLEAPDLLVLDEPTNHLDIDAVEWLEGFLSEFSGAVLSVSHDRYFMDAYATTIWELDFGQLETYRGNYSHYVQQREERHERLLKEFESQQEFIAKEEEYIRRNLAGQNTRQAQGRRTRLERLKRDELALRPHQRKALNLNMNTTIRSGDLVLRTRKLVVGHPDEAPLFQSPDITLRRGEVAAFIGPNGAGKSTLVKTIIEQIPPQSGEVVIGAAVKIGYFAQAHELLNENNPIIDEIMTVKAMGLGEARSYLGKFLFSGDDVFRPINTLSGGERGRVALAKLALGGANFLILDEPTNHLDIPSQEILQNVLADFAGTILIVSHDRYLIDALATQIWWLNAESVDGRKTELKRTLRMFESTTYKEYLAIRNQERLAAAEKAMSEREAEKAKSAPKQATKTAKHGLNPYQLKKRLAEIENQITALETRMQKITADLETASTAGDAVRASSLGVDYTETEAELDAVMTEWLLLSE